MKVGFFGLLTIALLILKLIGTISVSWWVVFAPVLVGFVLGLTIFVIAVLANLR